MKKVALNFFLTVVLPILLFSCSQNNKEGMNENGSVQADSTTIANDRKQIIIMLDSFNIAAAKADFNNYFKYFAEDGIFIGTDATENWNKKDFMVWAKPYFDKGNTWNFKSLERHIYFGKTGNMAWFDELLNTQMKICRGSGVLTKQGKEWKIQQYVLSMTIPNSQTDTIIKIKAPIEDEIIKNLIQK